MKARQIKTSSCRVKLRHDQIETLQRQIKMKNPVYFILTFSERATLLRDTERLLKLIILYNDDDDSDDVEKNENMVLFYPC